VQRVLLSLHSNPPEGTRSASNRIENFYTPRALDVPAQALLMKNAPANTASLSIWSSRKMQARAHLVILRLQVRGLAGSS
jgi:hypothetical protein